MTEILLTLITTTNCLYASPSATGNITYAITTYREVQYRQPYDTTK